MRCKLILKSRWKVSLLRWFSNCNDELCQHKVLYSFGRVQNRKNSKVSISNVKFIINPGSSLPTSTTSWPNYNDLVLIIKDDLDLLLTLIHVQFGQFRSFRQNTMIPLFQFLEVNAKVYVMLKDRQGDYLFVPFLDHSQVVSTSVL